LHRRNVRKYLGILCGEDFFPEEKRGRGAPGRFPLGTA
jgi:hypothetical protein